MITTQLKVHLGRLADLEYVLPHRVRQGQAHEYELVYAGEGETDRPFLMGLRHEDEAFVPELEALADEVQDELLAMVEVLTGSGPSVRRPHADTLAGSKHANKGATLHRR